MFEWDYKFDQPPENHEKNTDKTDDFKFSNSAGDQYKERQRTMNASLESKKSSVCSLF
jgi:hypothetical protein